MSCCKPEQVGTKEHGNMLKRIQVLEDGRVPAKEATHGKIEGQKRRITRKGYQRLFNKFEMEGLHGAKRVLESRKKQSFARLSALPREEVDTIREFQALHEENFLSSWLREDGKGKTKREVEVEVDREVKEDGGKKKGKKHQGERRRWNGSQKEMCERPLTFAAKGKFRRVIRVVLTLTVGRGRGRLRL